MVQSDGNVLTILTVSIIPFTLYLVLIGVRDNEADDPEDLGGDDNDGGNDQYVGFDNPMLEAGENTRAGEN
jgi:hypothetical protein